jgi:hypothetical protein
MIVVTTETIAGHRHAIAWPMLRTAGTAMVNGLMRVCPEDKPDASLRCGRNRGSIFRTVR